MATKLTLRIDEDIINEAKQYAQAHATSLSKMIASYLRSLTRSKAERRPVSPIVEEISGVLPRSLRVRASMKNYRRHLFKKYQ